MASTKTKYKVFWTFSDEALEIQLNGLDNQGYSLVFWDYRQVESSIDTKMYHCIMKLDTGYQDVVNLKDVATEEVDKHISEGWEITSTSLSTKFVRMIKRKAA